MIMDPFYECSGGNPERRKALVQNSASQNAQEPAVSGLCPPLLNECTALDQASNVTDKATFWLQHELEVTFEGKSVRCLRCGMALPVRYEFENMPDAAKKKLKPRKQLAWTDGGEGFRPTKATFTEPKSRWICWCLSNGFNSGGQSLLKKFPK